MPQIEVCVVFCVVSQCTILDRRCSRCTKWIKEEFGPAAVECVQLNCWSVVSAWNQTKKKTRKITLVVCVENLIRPRVMMCIKAIYTDGGFWFVISSVFVCSTTFYLLLLGFLFWLPFNFLSICLLFRFHFISSFIFPFWKWLFKNFVRLLTPLAYFLLYLLRLCVCVCFLSSFNETSWICMS